MSATEDTTCPTCARDGFASRKGMRSHHKQVHGESLAAVEVDCANCGESLERLEWQIGPGRQFCDNGCQRDWRDEDHGESPAVAPDETVCPTCGNEFPTPGRMQNHHFHAHGQSLRAAKDCPTCEATFQVKLGTTDRRVCCSRECAGKYRAETYGGEGHPLRDRIELECEWCGEIIEAVPSQEDVRRFCSHECKGEWRRDVGWFDAENNPRWTAAFDGARSLYRRLLTNIPPQSWRAARDHNLAEQCRICGDKDDLHLHHIVPLRSGGTNGAWNLMTLCPSCHTTVETHTMGFVDTHIGDKGSLEEYREVSQ